MCAMSTSSNSTRFTPVMSYLAAAANLMTMLLTQRWRTTRDAVAQAYRPTVSHRYTRTHAGGPNSRGLPIHPLAEYGPQRSKYIAVYRVHKWNKISFIQRRQSSNSSETGERFRETDLVGLLSVLVVGMRYIFSAVDAHIFPCFIQTVLEDVDWRWINDILWQPVSFVDYSVWKYVFHAVVLWMSS